MPSSTARSDFIVVQCLICQETVYQINVTDNHIGETAKQWSDNVILKSATGWVHVSNTCKMRSGQYKQLTESQEFSNSLGLNIKKDETLPDTARLPSPSTTLQSIPLHSSMLPPLPQFIPSPQLISQHPAFRQFADPAIAASQQLRQEAENKIRQVAEDQLRLLDIQEARLRTDLATLWLNFKRSYRELVSELPQDRLVVEPENATTSSNTSASSSLILNGFQTVPVQSRSLDGKSLAKPSALSTSLKSSGMHYQPPTQAPLSPRPSSASSTLVPHPPVFNEDLATSLRVMEIELIEAHARAASQAAHLNGRTSDQKRKRRLPQSVPTTSAFRTISPDPGTTDKGKRRVTFDANPKIVTIDQSIKEDLTHEEDDKDFQAVAQDVQMFDFEDAHPDTSTRPIVTTKSAPITFQNPHRSSRDSKAGISAFASLRPSSLPSYSISVPARLRTMSPPLSPDIEFNTQTEKLDGVDALHDSPHNDGLMEEATELEHDEQYWRVKSEADSHAAHLMPLAASPIRRSTSQFQPMAALLESESTGPSAPLPNFVGTYTEQFDQLVQAARDPSILSDVDASRQKVFDHNDRKRRIDPGPSLYSGPDDETDTEDGSSSSQTDPNLSPRAESSKGSRKAKKILERVQELENSYASYGGTKPSG